MTAESPTFTRRAAGVEAREWTARAATVVGLLALGLGGRTIKAGFDMSSAASVGINQAKRNLADKEKEVAKTAAELKIARHPDSVAELQDKLQRETYDRDVLGSEVLQEEQKAKPNLAEASKTTWIGLGECVSGLVLAGRLRFWKWIFS